MIKEISAKLQELLQFSSDDKILFNGKEINVSQNNFKTINPVIGKSIAFIDGGQAEILTSSNFCLSFIRVFGVVFKDNRKIHSVKKEFYVLTTCKKVDEELIYSSALYGDELIDKEDLVFNANDPLLQTGNRKVAVSKISNIARRFAELSLASQMESDFIVLDGTLEKSYPGEGKYLEKLANVSALAKTTDLVTVNGNNPANVLQFSGCWNYPLTEKTSFVKLHERGDHIFRFEGSREVLSFLLHNSSDPIFLGYPYGLIYADKMARVSNNERKSLEVQFMIRNKKLQYYLNSKNAHTILDSV